MLVPVELNPAYACGEVREKTGILLFIMKHEREPAEVLRNYGCLARFSRGFSPSFT